ncbi:TMF1 [Mytilus coruscus]|uniref:TMF1 n=1 Tax=Mytilus coruscus TaxID=42192 RepID=A0A6J8A0D4_MYTCO|nr:TMF1 [Mytilus coruscus]
MNVLVDTIRSGATFEGVVGEHYNIVSTASPTDITSQKTTSVTIGNKESRTIVMDKIPSSTSESAIEEDNEFMADDESCSSNTFERRIENDIFSSVKDKTDKVIKHRVSNIVLDETFNFRIDTNSLKTVKSRNDNIVMTKASISDFENLHNKDDKENIKRDIFCEKDNPLIRISTKHSSNKDDGEKLSKQVLQTRTKIKENGYKSKSMESQHDSRISYHSKHGCFEGTITTNVLNMDLQKEEFILPNIKPEELLGFSQEKFRTPRRRRRGSLEEDSFVSRLLDVDQPKTIREWLHYTNQMRAHASARVISGVVKLGRSQDVILVLDTSERMTGYFQKLKSAALQYVYGKCIE